MEATAIMDEAIPAADSSEGDRPLRAVIAYDDLAAGKRAMRVLADIGGDARSASGQAGASTHGASAANASPCPASQRGKGLG